METTLHLRPDRSDQCVILVAEDDVLVLNVARITLERVGCFVLTAENGHEALFLSRQYSGRIHLLLSDIQMPRLDGIELARQIQKERPGTHILLMSGYSHERNPGFGFMRKPFTPSQLSDTIRGLLRMP